LILHTLQRTIAIAPLLADTDICQRLRENYILHASSFHPCPVTLPMMMCYAILIYFSPDMARIDNMRSRVMVTSQMRDARERL